MAGKTMATLQRNVLNDIADLAGPKFFHWVDRQKGELRLFGRRVYVVGANTEESEERIRGATLAGALCDEVSLYPQSFFDMLMTRLSVKGAKCFCTCNPDHPTHWFYVNYITNDNIVDKKIWHFTLDDNPNLDPEYIEALKQSFTGVFYDRFIKGLWVAASGVIYRKFADNPEAYIIKEAPKDIMFCQIGVDFGQNKSAHAFNCTGFRLGYTGIVTLDEFYLRPVDYKPDTQLDSVQLTEEFIKFVQRQLALKRRVTEVFVDGEETVLKLSFERGLRKAGLGIPVNNARKREINDRIRFYNAMFGFGYYKIMAHCVHTIEAFKTAVWDDEKLKDVRLDDGSTNIDSLDGQEYSTENHQKSLIATATAKYGRTKDVS
jgi:PBSX family phage terminase large subunit